MKPPSIKADDFYGNFVIGGNKTGLIAAYCLRLFSLCKKIAQIMIYINNHVILFLREHQSGLHDEFQGTRQTHS